MSENNVSEFNIRMMVYCALFTALIIIGGYISIPIPVGPVPVALADFFVMLAGLFLGFKYGLISTVLYIALGALGLPVFAGGKAGLAVIAGPTGGFLFGYLFMTVSIGLIAGKRKPSVVINLIALIAGNILLYAIGTPWLKFSTNISWTAALAAGLTPFIAGIVIKIAAASALGRVLLPRFKQNMVSASAQTETGKGV
ncbi:MAG: biotin transporter BioY [Oscillospiraceae bacterium]|nr:biotin transporter BioY [Oscillospiraceae bacterium]